MANKGIAGFTGANVTITYGGTYTGGGLSGWSGGTTFVLCLSERSYEIMRQFAETICDQYQDGIGTTVGANVEFDAVNRSTDDPPVNLTDENIKIAMLIGNRTLTCVLFNESFKETGKATDAARYHLKGKSVGSFTFT